METLPDIYNFVFLFDSEYEWQPYFHLNLPPHPNVAQEKNAGLLRRETYGNLSALKQADLGLNHWDKTYVPSDDDIVRTYPSSAYNIVWSRYYLLVYTYHVM